MAEFSDARSGAYCTCTRERCSDECRTYKQFRPKPVTNANRIRSMTDKELAEFIISIGTWYNPITHESGWFIDGKDVTRINLLDWLKQESE